MVLGQPLTGPVFLLSRGDRKTPNLLFHETFRLRDVLRHVPHQQVHQGAACFRTHQPWFTLNIHHLGGFCDRSENHPRYRSASSTARLLSCPDFPFAIDFTSSYFEPAAIGNCLDKLPEHIVDERLHVCLLRGSQIARRIARVFNSPVLMTTSFNLAHFKRSP